MTKMLTVQAAWDMYIEEQEFLMEEEDRSRADEDCMYDEYDEYDYSEEYCDEYHDELYYEIIEREEDLAWAKYAEENAKSAAIMAEIEAHKVAYEVAIYFGDEEMELNDDEDVEIDMPLEVNRYNRAERRKQMFRARRKSKNNAVDAMNNYRKRSGEDMMNMTRCKKRGGHLVYMPKSQSMKAEAVWTRAAKMKLVEEIPA